MTEKIRQRGFEIVSEYQDKGINLPVRKTRLSAGYDIESAKTVTIPSIWRQVGKFLDNPNMKDYNAIMDFINKELETKSVKDIMKEFELQPTLVPTGVKAYMLDDEMLKLANRSSNPLKMGLIVSNGEGLIDARWYKMAIKVNCDYCGDSFSVYPARFESRKNLFCSVQCSSAFTKENNPNYIECDNCGKLFYKKPNKIEKDKTHCCSRKCMGELRNTLYLGENNPNYGNRGRNNPLTSEFRITSLGYKLVLAEGHPFAIDKIWIKEHRLIAEQFLMTEEHSIEVDGKRYLKRDLDVHHINENKLDNRPENLQILTRSEHKKLHHKLEKLKRK